MRKYLLAASAAALTFAAGTAANAAPLFTVSGTAQDFDAENSFQTDLNNIGLDKEVRSAVVGITGASDYFITFTYLASESGYNDTFYYGSQWFTETNIMSFPANVFMFTALGSGSAFQGYFDNGIVGGDHYSAGSGQDGFTVFVDSSSYVSGQGYSTIYIGFDDKNQQDPGKDDNSDDFILKATITAVPEPASWALMIAGVAAVGLSMRRRSTTTRVAFS